MSAMSALSADLDALVAKLPAADVQILAHRLADQSGFTLAPKADTVGFAAVAAAVTRLKAKAGQYRALATGFRKKLLKGAENVSVQDAQNADRFAEDLETVLSGLAEAQTESMRWIARIADIREASGVGIKPMLEDLPAAIKAAITRASDDGIRIVRLGLGEVIIDTGTHREVPSIFIEPAPTPGRLGEKASAGPLDSVLPGSIIIECHGDPRAIFALLEKQLSAPPHAAAKATTASRDEGIEGGEG